MIEIDEPRDATQRRQALAVLMDRPGLPAWQLDQQIESLVRHATTQGLSLENCLVATLDGAPVAACLCVDSPGRTSTVFLPANSREPDVADATVLLLEETCRRALARGVQLLQCMVGPDSSHESTILQRAGFTYLSQLLYLESDLMQPLPTGRDVPGLEWTSYSQERHKLFADVVQGTYEDSLDCGFLNGLRHIEDILASHRAAGEFDPALWLIGSSGGEPAGVVLLAKVPRRWTWEVVYMGVLKHRRRRGCGSALMRKAVELARRQAAVSLALSVDVRNGPARLLYEQFGFREASRRDAWIKALSGCAGQP